MKFNKLLRKLMVVRKIHKILNFSFKEDSTVGLIEKTFLKRSLKI